MPEPVRRRGGVTGERWRARREVVWRRSLDALIVLPPGTEEPVTVCGRGWAVWESLRRSPMSFDDLVSEMAETFEADKGVVGRDLSELLDGLAAIGVVERIGPAGPVTAHGR